MRTAPPLHHYDPYDDAEQRGIQVIHRPIRAANGFWYPDHNLIVIKAGMRAVHDRSALAHELAHAALGHRDDRPKHENRADQVAAANLIDAERCADLMRWCSDESQLASELGVSRRLLLAYLAQADQIA